MLKNRIISTLNFFDLQDYPLTLLELHKFLISDWEGIKQQTDNQGEVIDSTLLAREAVLIDSILTCVDSECRGEVQNTLGFYHLPGRSSIVQVRLNNYFFGIQREKLIKKYIRSLRFVPFVRGVALAGSQAMGQQKENSDIDLLVILAPGFMWLGRTLVTLYFQILGKRRHGQNIKNRFCLNHYLAGPKMIGNFRNLYTAAEYLKLRSLVYSGDIGSFQQNNLGWIKVFFPNTNIKLIPNKSLLVQRFLEKLFINSFGDWLERQLKNWQLPKIRQEKFIVVENDELSFHPHSKQQMLLSDFAKFQKQQERVTIKLVS